MITVVQIARLESTAASYIPLLPLKHNSPIYYTLLISLCQEDTQTLNDSHFVWVVVVCSTFWSVVVVFFSNKEDKWVFAVQFEKKDGNIW